MFELTIDHCSGFLECPGGSAYNFELRTGGPIKQSSQNVRRLRWCLALLFAAGCIATGSPAQTVRVQATEAAQELEVGKTIEGRLAGGQSHEYHFTLTAGQYARVLVEQHTINVEVAVIG